MIKWSIKDKNYLSRHFPYRKTSDIAKVLGRTYSSTAQKARIMGLKKSEKFYMSALSGRSNVINNHATRFKKGHKTWNKGLHFEAGGKSKETRFKKGNMPQTWRPIGSERIDKDGILVRKVSDNRSKKDWKPVHVLIWERENGPVPDGFIVIFKNKTKSDFNVNNLECISRCENMIRNGTWSNDPEIAKTIHARGVLNRLINKRIKHERQNG